MKVGKRNFSQLLKAITEKQHYIALLNMFSVYPNFSNAFIRYFFGKGYYPCKIKVRTPLGTVSPNINSYYDILTVNEIFCRKDYKADKNIKIILDLGSNIGISALYFLTRNNFSKCYLFEPVPENILRLKENLKEFQGRYELEEAAVCDGEGIKKFGLDPLGRCGGLLRESEKYISVKCVNINDVLKKIIEKEKQIDILKIDTEGNELNIVRAIQKEFFKKIIKIFIEIDYTVKIDKNFLILPEYYSQIRQGNMIKLTLRQ